ncbi:Dyp-type peroxidase [Epithele typhae]|uniref:Dyp-type peroxidase n=1 Tax=Epithele typhae TaxID=378194 RepID=UPI002007513A|nr:Dyp-type peroxidase [Epithele typhae]KAH9933659.1 Dyp-type peroxidase [Epithele typhae]
MSTPTIPPFDPANVQGDILAGLPKRVQHYLLFQIGPDVRAFRKRLAVLIPQITTTTQVVGDRAKIAENKKAAADAGKAPGLLKLSGVNIAFSQFGLTKLGITDNIGDTAFVGGQLNDAQNLADSGVVGSDGKFIPNWIPAFKQQLDGVVIISGDSELTVTATQAIVKGIFNVGAAKATMHEVQTIKGTVRPGKEKAHEHFGFLDGISQPAVKDFDKCPHPGQETVRQGVILCGRENDVDARTKQPVTRPPWALDGSFLALRFLAQLVPEFNTFLEQNPITSTGLTPAAGSELLGARLVGRWKSGAPIDVFPTADDPAAGVDPARNNDFRYTFPDDQTTQDRCPFAAHTRKTNPRADLEDPPISVSNENRRIIRRGVQFGPEVTPAEKAAKKTLHERGLIFAAYQSNIVNGFQFIQHSWANNQNFPPKASAGVPTPGFDAIIGQDGNAITARTLVGTDPSNQGAPLALVTEWVIPRGGEYFFSPSISALKSTFAL